MSFSRGDFMHFHLCADGSYSVLRVVCLALTLLVASGWPASSALAQVELPPISEADKQASPLSADIPSPAEAPSLEECEAFAVDLIAAIAAKDEKSCHGLIEWNSLLTRITGGVNAAEADRAAYIEGFLNPPNGQYMTPFGGFTEGTRYSLLRLRTKGGKRYALFRLIHPIEVGVSYHELPLVKRADGSIAAEDIYIYNAGEYLSNTFRKSYIQAASRENIPSSGTSSESEYLRNLHLIERMTASFKNGDARDVLAAYDLLPASMQRDKSLVIVRLMAANQVGGNVFQDVLTEVKRTHGYDPAMDLVFLAAYQAQGRYSEAFAAVDRIDRAIGGDPYLNVIRANLFLKRRNFRSARECVQAAIDADSKLVSAHLAMVNCAMYQKDFAEVARRLLVLEELGEEIADLNSVPGYKPFLASPAYQQWQQARKQK